MLPDSALKSMKVMFATPCYISAVSMNYVTSIFDLTHHAQRFGLDHILHMHSESLITRGRNKMVIRFLEDESLTHLFWIDSDIAFRPQSVCRLLLSDKDVSAAVYPMKSFNWPPGGLPQGMTRQEFEKRFGDFPYNPIDHGKAASKFADSDGFVEVAEAPTGFMCIKRHVLYAMMTRYPELNYVPDGPPNHPQAHPHGREPFSPRRLPSRASGSWHDKAVTRQGPVLARKSKKSAGASRIRNRAPSKIDPPFGAIRLRSGRAAAPRLFRATGGRKRRPVGSIP